LIAVSGAYVTVAMILNVSQADLPTGEQLPLKKSKQLYHAH